MALDSYLVSRLCGWARWAVRVADGGMGYPKQCAFSNVPGGGGDSYTPELNEGAIEIDLCVRALAVSNEVLYQAVFMHYRRGDIALELKLSHLGCSKQTYYNKIDLAHNAILGFLNDLACGIKLPNAK